MDGNSFASIKRIGLNIIGLQTPEGRLLFFGLVSLFVFLAPYEWLANLSIWQYLGIPMPSIGLTRAYHLLLHGDYVGAWDRNKLIFLVLAIGLPMLFRDLMKVWYNYRLARSIINRSSQK